LNFKIKPEDLRKTHLKKQHNKQQKLAAFFDVFKGEVQPPHVLSVEAFRKAKSLLSENGMTIVNLNGYLKHRCSTKSLTRPDYYFSKTSSSEFYFGNI